MDIVEWKVIDSGIINNGPALTTGGNHLINPLIRGTDYTQRVGRIIQMETLEFFLAVEPGITAPTGDSVRTIIYADLQANGAAPFPTDLLNTADYSEPFNLNNRERFVIYYDTYVDVEASNYMVTTLTAGSPKTHTRRVILDLNLPVIFNGSNLGTAADFTSGALYVLFISANGNNNVRYNARIRFSDS